MFTGEQIRRIRRVYGEYLKSATFNADFEELHPGRGWMMAGIVLAVLVLRPKLALRGWRGAVRREFASAKVRREYAELAETGVPIVTYAGMFNSSLRGGDDGIAPALVVGSFNGDLREEEIKKFALIAGTAAFMAETPAEKELARLLRDDDYLHRRRRVLPPALTDSREVIAFDILISGDHLPDDRLRTPRIVCLADPNPGGIIVALPGNLLPECGIVEPCL